MSDSFTSSRRHHQQNQWQQSSLSFSRQPMETGNGSSPYQDDTDSSSNTNVNKEPIYITIGPQGAGKTTLLSKLLPQSFLKDPGLDTIQTQSTTLPPIHDIAIDDQLGVYLKIPTELFLINGMSDDDDDGDDVTFSSTLRANHGRILQSSLHNKTLYERIYDTCNDEMRYVTQRLCNRLTAEDFKEKIKALYAQHTTIQTTWQNILVRDMGPPKSELGADGNLELTALPDDRGTENNMMALMECIVEAVEEVYNANMGGGCFPLSHVDLYVTECIFKDPREEHVALMESLSSTTLQHSFHSLEVEKSWLQWVNHRRMSGLSAAISKLGFLAQKEEFQSIPLAWGNTNSKPRDYSTALEAAEQSGRPVYFIPYMNPDDFSVECDEMLYLPRVGIKTLIQRNIRRYMTTGRFVPTRAIVDTCHRVDLLVHAAWKEMKKTCNITIAVEESTSYSKLELDCAMAALASYGMNQDRTVYKIMSTSTNGVREGDRNVRSNSYGNNGRDGTNYNNHMQQRLGVGNRFGTDTSRMGRGDRFQGRGRDGQGRGFRSQSDQRGSRGRLDMSSNRMGRGGRFQGRGRDLQGRGYPLQSDQQGSRGRFDMNTNEMGRGDRFQGRGRDLQGRGYPSQSDQQGPRGRFDMSENRMGREGRFQGRGRDLQGRGYPSQSDQQGPRGRFDMSENRMVREGRFHGRGRDLQGRCHRPQPDQQESRGGFDISTNRMGRGGRFQERGDEMLPYRHKRQFEDSREGRGRGGRPRHDGQER